MDHLRSFVLFQSNYFVIKPFRNVSIYSFLALHHEEYQLTEKETLEDREYPIEAKIDLSAFKHVISTNTHEAYISKLIEPGDS